MRKYRLKNGITVLFEKNSSKSVAVEIVFNVGSNFEDNKVSGISHYLEHMLFEGTKKRKTSRDIANEIEKYGAEFNAYTNGERTAFFIKIINKKFDNALDILSDMVANPTFDEKIMEKEKKVILKEINMVTDDPRQYQWVLFQRKLFTKHPAGNPTYGNVKTVKNINRKVLVEYYGKYYVPNNMIISISGNVGKVNEKIKKYFGKLKPKKIDRRKSVEEPPQTKVRKFVEKRNIQNSYMVLGYQSVTRKHPDSYVFDVINGILGRGQSGWMFNEIRNKMGLAYNVGISHEQEGDYGYFSVYAGLDKKYIEKAIKIIFEQFKKLQEINWEDLEDAMTFIEGNYTLNMEDNFQYADTVAFWENIKDSSLVNSYLKKIRMVTIVDVKRVSQCVCVCLSVCVPFSVSVSGS